MTAALIICAMLVTLAIVAGLFMLVRERVRYVAGNDQAAIAVSKLRVESEHELAKQAIAHQAKAPGDFLAAATVCNSYGFRVMRDGEVPTLAATMGFVVIHADAWNGLLDAIRKRTNISGEVDGILKHHGFEPAAPPPNTADDL